MTHPRTSARRSAQPSAPSPGRSDASVVQATLQLSRLPPEEMRDLVLAFRTFRAAHPRDPISLLEFAGEYHRRAFRQADPKSRA